PAPADEAPSPDAPSTADISFDQLHEAWARSVLPAVREGAIPVATLLNEESGGRPRGALRREGPQARGGHCDRRRGRGRRVARRGADRRAGVDLVARQ